MEDVVFLKVDVDECEDIAAEYNVSLYSFKNHQQTVTKQKCYQKFVNICIPHVVVDHSHANLHLHQEQEQGC